MSLSTFDRINRRAIAQGIKETSIRAESNYADTGVGYAYRLILNQKNPGKGIVVASLDERYGNRDQRIELLNNLVLSASYKYNLDETVGYASESISCKLRSYDFMCAGKVSFDGEMLEQVKKMSKMLWRKRQRN